MTLEDGSRIGIVGGGPAGSLSAYFLLAFAQRMGLDLQVDIYEPRDFTLPGPAGCNMCGGIVSESLVQALAIDGINLPPTVVQRGIDSYVLHTAEGSVRIATPLQEKRIAAVHRGGGPRNGPLLKGGGLDGYLLALARDLGAKVIPSRVSDVRWEGARPLVRVPGAAHTYDLLVGATGVNSAGWQLFEKLGLPSRPVKTTKTYISELHLGAEAVTQYFGSAMHLFLLDIPRLDCAAIIPKGEFVTVCLLGREIDRGLIAAFFESAPVTRCFPTNFNSAPGICHCAPRINVREASRPFMDRVVLVGDCGATRLYKDGIGAAYRTAKAAARTAVFNGVSARAFQRYYWPPYRAIVRDNHFGWTIFMVIDWIKTFRPLLRSVLRTATNEQAHPEARGPMSLILWDTFTGSAPYRDVFFRALAPGVLGRFAWESALAAIGGIRARSGGSSDG